MQDNAHTSNFIPAAASASRAPMCSPAAGPPPPSVMALLTIGSSAEPPPLSLVGLFTIGSSIYVREMKQREFITFLGNGSYFTHSLSGTPCRPGQFIVPA